ncbi:hypothetical protein EXIGLDRAFT_783131 [Exidia glandulosa HHB12029]|uniref:Uncharacterized protein n=1 Tax=Exidia glandulosa HHB12029 TaxID=1314781 RepID=A0A165Z2U5_EXIGL|nr:hypothetical protein EXIGLDRAFT_783131 [Exidia glandulosa HHB12029]
MDTTPHARAGDGGRAAGGDSREGRGVEALEERKGGRTGEEEEQEDGEVTDDEHGPKREEEGGGRTPESSGATQSPQVSENGPLDGARAHRPKSPERQTMSARSDAPEPPRSEAGRNTTYSGATQSRQELQASGSAGRAIAPPTASAASNSIDATASSIPARAKPDRPAPTAPRSTRAPSNAPPSNAPRAPRAWREPSSTLATSSRKRSTSPMESPRPSKRVDEDHGVRTQFVPFNRTEAQWAQQRAHINELEEEKKAQKKTIEDLKNRVAELARDKYIALNYGAHKLQHMKRDNLNEWDKLFAQCWKKEFNEQYYKYHAYEDLSDREPAYAETGTSTDAAAVATYTYAVEESYYDDRGESNDVQMSDVAHYQSQTPQGQPEPEREVPLYSLETDAECAAARTEHGSVDDYLNRLANDRHERSKIDPRERVEFLRYVPSGNAEGAWIPIPLGKEGHPYMEGWKWGWVETRRLVPSQCTRKEFIAPTSHLFAELAIEASSVDFCHRSSTQRVVTSIATTIPGLKDRLWPAVPEPDVLVLCQTNATKLSPAIRRQYYVPAQNGEVYAEFDSIDISFYICLHCARPDPKEDKKEQVRRWNVLIDYFILQWLPSHAPYESEPEWERFYRGPRPFACTLREDPMDDETILRALWQHLLCCGFTTESMVYPGELWHYQHRANAAERDRALLAQHYKKPENTNQGNQKASHEYVSRWLMWHPMDSGRATVRVQLSPEQRDLYWAQYEKKYDSMKKRWNTNNMYREQSGFAPYVYHGKDSKYRPWIPMYAPVAEE